MSRVRSLWVMAGLTLALVTGLPTASGAVDRDGNYGIIGYGTVPCASLHQSNEAGIGNWLGGYLTAINQAYRDTYDIKGDLDLDGVVDWLYDYCSAHGDDAIGTAATAFFESHYPSRRVSR